MRDELLRFAVDLAKQEGIIWPALLRQRSKTAGIKISRVRAGEIMRELERLGLVVRLSARRWVPPESALVAAKQRREKPRAKDLLITCLADGKSKTSRQLWAAVSAGGYRREAYRSAIKRMIRAGEIVNTGWGCYRLGEVRSKKAAKRAPRKANPEWRSVLPITDENHNDDREERARRIEEAIIEAGQGKPSGAEGTVVRPRERER